MWDRLLVDCRIATLEGTPRDPLGVIDNGAIGIADGKIVRVGKRTELAGFRAKDVVALGGAWLTPGLIDCHTHLVFGGTRADEHATRRAGATYEEIAKAGGGIASTVAPTPAATSVDAYSDTIAFTPDEVERLFKAAAHHGLRVRLHAEQLSNQHGAALAAQYRALSADHLEHLDEAGAKAMASAGTVAVLLPGAYYALQEKKKPPVALLRKHKVPIAIATDCNPGTSPLLSPTLAMNMACTLFGLTPDEAVTGMTVNAARALGLAHTVGSIAAGKQADLCVWQIGSLAELGYWIGLPGPERRIFNGADA